MSRKTKLPVPVEAFPQNANIMGILLGHKGASHKALEQLTGCTIEIYKDEADSINPSYQNDAPKKILPNDKIYLLVGYNDPRQIDTLRDLLFQIAEKATHLLATTGTINLKSIFDNGAFILQNQVGPKPEIKKYIGESSRSFYGNEKFLNRHTKQYNSSQINDFFSPNRPHKFGPQILQNPSCASEGLPSAPITLHSTHGFSNLTRPVQSNIKQFEQSSDSSSKNLPTNIYQNYQYSGTICKESYPLHLAQDEFQFLWKFHMLLAHYTQLKDSDIRSKFLNFYKNEGSIAQNLFDHFENKIQEYPDFFVFDPPSRSYSSALEETITEREFFQLISEKLSYSFKSNDYTNYGNAPDFIHEETHLSSSFDNSYKVKACNNNPQPLSFPSHTYSDLDTGLESIRSNNLDEPINMSGHISSRPGLQMNYKSRFSRLSFTLQLIHRTLVKAARPVLIDHLEKLFEYDWSISIDLTDLEAATIRELIFKHDNIFQIHEDPTQNQSYYISPIFRPKFEPIFA